MTYLDGKDCSTKVGVDTGCETRTLRHDAGATEVVCVSSENFILKNYFK